MFSLKVYVSKKAKKLSPEFIGGFIGRFDRAGCGCGRASCGCGVGGLSVKRSFAKGSYFSILSDSFFAEIFCKFVLQSSAEEKSILCKIYGICYKEMWQGFSHPAWMTPLKIKEWRTRQSKSLRQQAPQATKSSPSLFSFPPLQLNSLVSVCSNTEVSLPQSLPIFLASSHNSINVRYSKLGEPSRTPWISAHVLLRSSFFLPAKKYSFPAFVLMHTQWWNCWSS